MHVSYRLPIRSVKTRWNSVFEMVDPLISLWRPLNAVMKQVAPKDNTKFSAAFMNDANMAFSNHELSSFERVKTFLEPFYQTTKDLSVGHHPTVHLVIPLFTYLCKSMEAICRNNDHPDFLRNGAQAALDKLKKYMNCICRSDACIVATCELCISVIWF